MSSEGVIIQNLKEHFKALEDAVALKEEHFVCSAVFDYCCLISYTQETAEIIKEMVKMNEIGIELLDRIFLFSFSNISLYPSVYGEHAKKFPLFWDREVEESRSLVEKTRALFLLEKKRIEEAKERKVSVFDLELPEDVLYSGMTDNEEYLSLRSLHNKLLLKLSQKKEQKIYFDKDKSLLVVGIQNIKIRKYSDAHFVLSEIFSEGNLSKEWFFSELSEKYDSEALFPDKKFYNSIYQINLKLREKGITDLFVTTRQSITINKSYFSS